MQFFLGRDQSSHWYVIPEEHRAAWEEWCDLDEDDEASWIAPKFAIPVNGSPSNVTFTNPEI